MRGVSTSFTSSVSLARSHWGRKGPDRSDRADLKVRGEPEGSRLRTGAPEEETKGREMRGRVVGEGLQERPTDARVVFRLWERGVESGRGGKRETRHGGGQQPVGWLMVG